MYDWRMENLFNYYLSLIVLLGSVWDAYCGNGPFIGIDLGTKYSCVGVFKKGKVNIIADDQGNRCIPSLVAFTEDGQRLIGDSARRQLTSNPDNTISDVKRFIGRTWDDPSVQQDIKFYPFKIIDENNKPYFEIRFADGVQTFAPEEITAMILGKLKEMAEDYLRMTIDNVVVTVPAYFNDAQRSATKDSATIAGFKFVRLFNEPTAAAISHEDVRKDGKNNIVVYDLGGGTFDVSVIESKKGVFKVLATSGDTHLGGEDFDQRVMDYFIKVYQEKTGEDLNQDKHAVQKLRCEVEKAKISLSSAEEVSLKIHSLLHGSSFQEHLTRAKFEELNVDLFTSTKASLTLALKDAALGIRDIDEIILVGGSTRIPKIRELVSQFFYGKKLSQGINPDEAVVVGAAVQAGVLSGQSKPGYVNLTDVNPFTLSYEVYEKQLISIIPRNTPIPVKKSCNQTTASDFQRQFIFKVYEGESNIPKLNHLLGTFLLTDLTTAARGVPVIKINFEIDVNGILTCTAFDIITDSRSSIIDSPKLSSEDMEYMITRANELRDKDKIMTEITEVRYNFENDLYTLKHQLMDGGLDGQTTEEEKVLLLEFVENNIEWLDDNPIASLDAVKLKKVNLDENLKLIFDRVNKQTDKDKRENKYKDDL